MKTPKLPDYILQNGTKIPWAWYAKDLANKSTEKYKAQKYVFTVEIINRLAVLCQTDAELDPEDPACVGEVLEQICIAIENTESMPKNKPEETPVETPPEQPSNEPTLPVEVLPPENQGNDLDEQELLILEAARKTRLESYADLRESFDFGADMMNPLPKDGAIVTPMDYGAMMGLGADMGKKGIWILIHGAQGLLVRGKEHVMEQICASLGLSEKTVYNYLTTLPYATAEARALLSSTALVELCTRKYSDDPEENEKIKKELVQEAVEHGWSSSEARSHAEMKQGKDRQITDGTSSKTKLRYFHQLPDGTAIMTRECPAYTEGAIIFDMKTMERMVDTGSKIEFQPVLREPSNEAIAASK